jgi:serpin B
MQRLLLSFLVFSLAAACGGETAQLLRADLPRVTAPDVSPDKVEELVSGNNRFAFDLYRAVAATSDGNLIYSPYSISLAFSIVYAGARGETAIQMAEVLGYLPQETQHPAFNALDQGLSRLAEQSESGATDGEPFQLHIANSVWGQQGNPFRDAYLDTLAQQYGAGLRPLDFARDPAGAIERINGWVTERTQQRIQKLVSPNMISRDTRLVLANAIYFKATWVYQFEESDTQHAPFTLLDGSQVTVPLMTRSTTRVPYAVGKGYQTVRLPYHDSSAEMMILLPAEGQFEALEAQLSGDIFAWLREAGQLHDVTLTMPRFEFETELDLVQALQGMGLTSPFGAEADFNGMVEGGGLHISAAIHKANITVDEKGTEAAAATAVMVNRRGFPIVEMTLDRPFIYAIVAQDTGTILFLGRVMNPAG